MAITDRWYITEHAVERFAHVLGHRDLDSAERTLRGLIPTAAYRETDRLGRELWRSPRASYGLRWVVSVAKRREGALPQVVWVGQARPPAQWWDPVPEQAAPVEQPAKRTRGRPPKPVEERKVQVATWITPAQRAALDELLARGVGVAEVIEAGIRALGEMTEAQ